MSEPPPNEDHRPRRRRRRIALIVFLIALVAILAVGFYQGATHQAPVPDGGEPAGATTAP